jgi:myo-inositol-1(or 4)-monophosphatase
MSVGAFARELAVGAATRAHAAQAEVRAEEKAPRDLVTQVERRLAGDLTDAIRERYPDDRILCEDAAEGHAGGGRERTWYVDPVDGTTNYVHGYPFYATAISVYDASGEPLYSAVHGPALAQLFEAHGHIGATLNGAAIRVSGIASLAPALVLSGFSHRVERDSPELTTFCALSQSAGTRRSGCATLDMCHVAAGFAEGYCHANLRPWDVAAGAHIVIAAGGTVSDATGRPFDPANPSIVTSNGACHRELLTTLSNGRVEGSMASARG